MEGLFDLYEIMAPAALIFVRIIAFFLSAPIIGGPGMPRKVKIGLALILTMIMVPLLWDDLPRGYGIGFPFVLSLMKEGLVGVIMGFVVNIFVMAVQFGGNVIGRTVGFAAAEVFNPSTEDLSGPIGDFFYIAMILLFFMADGHQFFIASLSRSFMIAPIGSFHLHPDLYPALLETSNELFVIGTGIALPILAVIMAVVMAEGVITRTIPQINILHITFALKIMIFLLIMFLSMPTAVAFLTAIMHMIQEHLHNVQPLLGELKS